MQFFWTNFRYLFEADCFDISISKIIITFGIHTAEIYANLKIFLILLAKYIIFVCKNRKKLPI